MLKNAIGVDLETTGLYPLPSLSKIFCCAVNTGKSIKVHTEIDKLKAILEDRSITKIIHNASFDMFWLLRLHNIRVQNVWCTRLMEQIILGETLPRSAKDEKLKQQLSSSLLYTLARYGLANLENKELGASFASKNPNEPLTNKEIEYAKNDVKYLLKLQQLQQKKLEELDLIPLAKLENDFVEVLVDMQNRGIGFDKSYWLTLSYENKQQYNKLLRKLPKSVDNWNSSKQVCKYFQSVGIPLTSLTDAENYSKKYDNKELKQFVEARALYKAVTTYGESWLEDDFKTHHKIHGGKTIDDDNRVRTLIEQIINTGRLASSHPNLHQLPRDGKYRGAFIPKKGFLFGMCDYPSQEIAIAAAASGEESWINAILNGDDIHCLTASKIFPQAWADGTEESCTFPKKCKCKKHNEIRFPAKIINFTILYGGGAKNVSLNASLVYSVAIKAVHRFKKSVPKLIAWLEDNAQEAVKTRISYSADPYKRRRVMRDPEPWMLENIGKNNPIQACGANMIKRAMVNAYKKGVPLVLQVHDELITEFKNKKHLRILKEVMEEAADYCTGIPGLIKVEPIIAKNLLKQ
jgi:DNA polymerase-1